MKKNLKKWKKTGSEEKRIILQEPGYTNSIGMEFMRIPEGFFIMGSDPGFEDEADEDEGPMCKVQISKPFYLGKYPVTQAQWTRIMGKKHPCSFEGEAKPVDSVSWTEVQNFIRKLNELGERVYRLPTEAEWEYAARAGNVTTYFFGDDVEGLGNHGWFRENSEGGTRPVGLLAPNAWGLHDMYGNVWEWVHDLYGNYPGGLLRDPTGAALGSLRVLRGGCWGSPSKYCRSANRTCNEPFLGRPYDGFRLAFSL